jgi:hypothetical protein
MRRLVWAALVLGLMTARVRAADDEFKLSQEFPYQQNPARAGFPRIVSCLAIPSQTPAYYGYFVGGGRVFGGNGAGPLEGTWGWDYGGRCLYNPCLVLGFGSTHYQGGTGSYKTDKGPKVPNPLGYKIPSHNEHGECSGEGEGH